MAEETPLGGGRTTPGVVRVGDTVRRPMLADGAFRQRRLGHLERVGFPGAPRFFGIDAEGREILTFIPGAVPDDLGHYGDQDLAQAARLLRAFHDATAGADLAAGEETVCHNDWGPPNTVFQSGRPAALIDFDTAAPGPRLWDLGQSAWLWLDLGDDAYTGAEQQRRLALFAAAYDWPPATADAVVVHVLARQAVLAAGSRERRRTAIEGWARHCADWTVRHVLKPGLRAGLR